MQYKTFVISRIKDAAASTFVLGLRHLVMFRAQFAMSLALTSSPSSSSPERQNKLINLAKQIFKSFLPRQFSEAAARYALSLRRPRLPLPKILSLLRVSQAKGLHYSMNMERLSMKTSLLLVPAQSSSLIMHFSGLGRKLCCTLQAPKLSDARPEGGGRDGVGATCLSRLLL
jgi:hypothetical protein